MRKLQITKAARKFLEALDVKQYRQLARAVFDLMSDPFPPDSKNLSGPKPGVRRKDVGEYRIIYEVSEDTVSILVIGKRNDDDVYKVWGRLP